MSVLVLIGLMPASAHAQMDATYAGQAEILIKDYVRNELFSGTVLVARNGKAIFRKGFGAASREWAIPNATSTRFRIGSIGKQFTATAILKLVDEKKLELDEPIKTYLSDIPSNWERVTIRQLIAHTSGIPSYTGHKDFNDKLIRLKHTPQQLLELVKAAPLDFEPGSKFRYGNTGYILLGLIIEAASGLSYQDYLEQKLLKPLDLVNSGYDDGRKIIKHAAQGYSEDADHVVKAGPVDMSFAGAAGGMYSTVDDLLAWQQMLANGKVLSPASTAAMFTDSGHRYGLGWFISERFSRKIYEHGGTLPGFNSTLDYYPDDKLTVIILSNFSDLFLAGKISNELAGLALGLPPVHRQVKVDSRRYSLFQGRYQLTPDMVISIARNGDRLFAQVSGQKQLEIYPESEYSYFYKAIDAVLTFDKEVSGRVEYVTLHQGGEKIKAKRID
ncbi:MAG: serine hydrolase [Telluria sp.]